jgi:predicted nucleotidyltransferase
MVINKILEPIFSTPSNISILRVLNERMVGISGRESSRLSGLSLRTAQKSLSNLNKLGIVEKHIGNKEHVYKLNRKNFISKKIISLLLEFEKQFKIQIINLIKKHLQEPAVSVFIFGSVARGEESVKSDLDICIVYAKNISLIKEKVSFLGKELNKKFSINLAPFYISVNEFKKRIKLNKPPVNNIIKEGILVSGQRFD